MVGAGLHHFSGTARTEGQDGAQLRHDVHVVPALPAGAAPTHVLKAAGHILLPVEVVGDETCGPQGRGGIVQHGLHGRSIGNGETFHENAAALFQRQRVDGDVIGPQFQTFVQRTVEALRCIRRQTCDEVHVDVGEPVGPHQLHGPHRIRRDMAAADGGEDVILHGLRIHADPCDAVTFQNGQFFGGDGIRTADLYRDLRTGGEIEGFFQSRQDGIHLIRRQDAGGAAAHVEGAGPQMVFPHHFSPSPDLRDQGLYIGLHQRKTSLHALTDKGAVGATGGTEGNTHIQVDIPLFQPLQRLIAHGTSLQSQRRPVLRDEIARLQFPLGFLRGLALHQRPCDGLVGSDAGEHPPGGQR